MARPILIVAHPGHELRLFAWMERVRPLVCILTDGSAGASLSRTGYSIAVLEATGAPKGPVMGERPDREWYSAILGGNAAPFEEAAERIARAAEQGAQIIADPVEGYNPMHDLCSAIADSVAERVGGQRATYPLVHARHDGEVSQLDGATVARKLAAISSYTPLAEQVAELLRVDQCALSEEWILPTGFVWPEVMHPAPYYEQVGADRVKAGAYNEIISYQRHVRAIALRLRRHAALSPLALHETDGDTRP